MKNKITIIIILVLMGGKLQAQYQDLIGWYSVGAEIKLNKWKLELKEQLQFNDNSLHIDKHLTELDIKFKHTKWLSYGLGTRYYFKRNNNNIWLRALRLNLDINLRFKVKKIGFISRSRIQSSLNPENTIGRLHSDESLLRERITLDYNIKKYNIKPFISGEFFVEDYFAFNGGQRPIMNLRLDKLRFKIGIDWKINKQNKLKFSYGYQQELSKVYNQRDFMISLAYTYRILTNKKKKNEIK